MKAEKVSRGKTLSPRMKWRNFRLTGWATAFVFVRVLTPHSCRHTFVSQMQALGIIDIETIQSIVGSALFMI
ncbi:MAG: hypothetical protein VB078_09015 [Clostridiaceae bacterium]|nr:hypothetical protein [Clostridiaceae bacterium]